MTEPSPATEGAIPHPVLKNIETIIELETQHEYSLPLHQRWVEKVAASFGRPWFLYFQVIFFTLWGLISRFFGAALSNWQIPRFNLYEQGLDIASLLISTGVLIYQARQEKIAEERSHLMLQLNLLAEQKTAKLIALVEELRQDLPNVRDRYDSEASEMQKTADPQVVLNVLKETLNSTAISQEQEQAIEECMTAELLHSSHKSDRP
jgi:uncharacterized membrane protein